MAISSATNIPTTGVLLRRGRTGGASFWLVTVCRVVFIPITVGVGTQLRSKVAARLHVPLVAHPSG
jgi:hypothetical protein